MSAPGSIRRDEVVRAAVARIRDMIHTSDGPFSRDIRIALGELNALEAIRQAANAWVESSDGLAEDRERAAFDLAALLGQYEAGAL